MTEDDGKCLNQPQRAATISGETLETQPFTRSLSSLGSIADASSRVRIGRSTTSSQEPRVKSAELSSVKRLQPSLLQSTESIRPERLSPLPPPPQWVPERVTSIDIERRPLHVKTWGLWDQNIGIGQILEDSRMVSFAAITEGGKPLFRSEFHNGRTKMLNDLWEVLDEADHIISYNGKAFDLKHINTELLKEGLSEPSKYDHTDLLPFVRRKFKFDSNKLDYVSQRMRVGKKLDHGVSYFELLDGCEAGDPKSLAHFKKYNIQDTLLNLDLYREFKELGWL